jgi:predicted ribosomally synthesized peptide with SipW-like signal peptide
MRNIVLMLILVVAIVAGGMGGTFATWSDSETSANNTIVTGSLDLKVNGSDDEPWGNGVPTLIGRSCVVPCTLYGPYDVELWNAGQCEYASKAFMRLKEAECSNVDPKLDDQDQTTGYPDPYSGDLKPEPELVAEFGGKVDCTWNTPDQEDPQLGGYPCGEFGGVGVIGDDCTLGNFTYVWVMEQGYGPMLGPPLDWPWDGWNQGVWPQFPDAGPHCFGQGYLAGLDPVIDLMYLCPCQPEVVSIYFKVLQPPEEFFGMDIIENDGSLHWEKFNDWPSWGLMLDKIEFTVEFDLLLDPNDDQAPFCPPNAQAAPG